MQSSPWQFAVWAGTVMSLLSCGPSVLVEPPSGDEEVASRGEAIVGGTLASGDPAVVVLAVNAGGGQLEEYCTGTLIAPKTVLTAAHCINAYGPGNFYVVGFGPNIGALTRAISVAQQVKHPNYNGRTWDFGILRLSQPATGIAPVPLNETPLTSADIGRPIRHVGFGIINASGVGSGVKREVTYNLRQVTTYLIESGAPGKQTCSGDSGGPAFMVMPGSDQEKLVGVVSYGDEACSYEGWDGRVDKVVTWIRTTMSAWEVPTCALDGACVPGCTPVDQDCACAADGQCTADCADLLSDPDCPRDCVRNGVCAQADCPTPDPDCVAEGSLCSAAQQCRDRLCVSDSQHPGTYCTKRCASSADCPGAMECAAGTCRFPLKPERQLFDPCSPTDDFCVNSICTGPAGGITRCVTSCTVSSDCPAGSVCEAGADARRYCRPDDLKFTPTILPATSSLTAPAASGCTSVGPGLPSLWLLALALPALRRRRASTYGPCPMRMRFALSLSLALAACGPADVDAPPGEPQRREDAIVGGTVTTGDPNVFMLIIRGNNGTGSLCTGTLIDRRTILTAAHCVDPSILGATAATIIATNAPNENQIAWGVNTWNVVETRKHPSWNPATLTGDIALALLQSAPNVTPKPWNQSPVSSGQAVRSVGYGSTGASNTGSGVKRTVDLVINRTTSTLIFLGNGTDKGICHGDSGGPTFRTFPDGVERVVGVHSFTRTQDCTDGAATRVDAYKSFVQQWLTEKEAPTCGLDGRCVMGCTPVDLDCVCGADGQCTTACPDLNVDPDCGDCGANGVCAARSCPVKDPDCIDEGQACTSPSQCAGRRCVVDAQHTQPYCSRPCSSSADCGAGMECEPAGGFCRFVQLPAAGVGERCVPGGTFCGERGVCTGSSVENTRCHVSCDAASQCPKDHTCTTGYDGARYCLEPPKPPILLARADVQAPAATGCSTGPGLFPVLGLLLVVRRRPRPA